MLASWGGSYANRGCAAREVRGDDRRGNLFSRPRKEVFSENREKTVLTVKGEVISCFTASYNPDDCAASGLSIAYSTPKSVSDTYSLGSDVSALVPQRGTRDHRRYRRQL